jgi:hypothetical protein
MATVALLQTTVKMLRSCNIGVLAAENTCLHFSRVVAAKQSGPQPRRLQNLGLHARACVQKNQYVIWLI